jgi:Flp pilus assembly pilin Flp
MKLQCLSADCDAAAAYLAPHCENRCAGVVRQVIREMEKNMLVSLECLLARYGIVLGDEEGQGLIEYVLIAALISVVAIAAIRIVGTNVSGMWTNVQTATTAPAP